MEMKEFGPYELAVKLKALGFDEPCFGFFNIKGKFIKDFGITKDIMDSPGLQHLELVDNICLAPTFSQAFRWFREKQAIEGFIHKAIEGTYYFVIKRLGNNESNMYEFITNAPKNVDTYEEAELACLTKLIEIVEGIENTK